MMDALRSSDLVKRLGFLVFALLVYRLGCFITLPAVDPSYIGKILEDGVASGLLGMLNLFSGGALGRMTIFALNVMPYIVSSIVVQVFVSSLKNEKKIDPDSIDQKKISFYSKVVCVILSCAQSYVIVSGLNKLGAFGSSFGLLETSLCISTLVGASIFLIWLGSQITSCSIGNGVSMIIFAGIVAELPSSISSVFNQSLFSSGAFSGFFVLFTFVMLLILIVMCERSYRNIPVTYPARVYRDSFSRGPSSSIPVKINVSGVIPPIFANAILIFPLTIANLNKDCFISQFIAKNFAFGQPLYFIAYFIMIVFFCFFYSDFVFNTKELAESLKKSGAVVSGKRPGIVTKNYLDYILSRVTAFGALYISFICIFPDLIKSFFSVNFALGGTSLLIVVSVVLDFLFSVQAHMFSHKYNAGSKSKSFVLTGV